MDYEFWSDSDGKSPIFDEIGRDSQLKEKIVKKLEYYRPLSFDQLKKAGEIEKVKLKNKNKIHELRIDIGKRACRFLFVYKNGITCLLRFILKKGNKIKGRDVNIADGRADKII